MCKSQQHSNTSSIFQCTPTASSVCSCVCKCIHYYSNTAGVSYQHMQLYSTGHTHCRTPNPVRFGSPTQQLWYLATMNTRQTELVVCRADTEQEPHKEISARQPTVQLPLASRASDPKQHQHRQQLFARRCCESSSKPPALEKN